MEYNYNFEYILGLFQKLIVRMYVLLVCLLSEPNHVFAFNTFVFTSLQHAYSLIRVCIVCTDLSHVNQSYTHFKTQARKYIYNFKLQKCSEVIQYCHFYIFCHFLQYSQLKIQQNRRLYSVNA